jgi:ABC-type lipoprotein release transport system permease subunit
MLYTLAWRNIWRNRNRSIITIASIASAVLLSVVTASLQKGVFDNLIRNVVSLYTGHIQIHEKGYWEEQILDNSFDLNDTLINQLENIEGIIAAAPRIEAFSLVSGGKKTKGALVIGVSPEKENELTHLKNKLVEGHYISENEEAVLVAEGLAEKLFMGVGDTIVLLAQGLLHFASPELNRQVLYLNIPTAQRWLDAPQRATTIAITIKDDDELNKMTELLKDKLPPEYEVITWEEMMPEIVQHIKSDTAGNYIFLGVLYLIISFGIFSTLLMMLAERQREFGMLVALGMRKRKIALMLFSESLLLTFFGSLAGIATSLPITWWLTENPIKFSGELGEIYEKFGFEAVLPATMHPPIFINQTIVVLSIGVILAFYPAWKALKLDPVEAMRR